MDGVAHPCTKIGWSAVEALLPILNWEIRDAAEFPDVVRHEGRAMRSCMGSNQQVVVADGPADPFQFATDHAVVPVHGFFQGKHLDCRQNGFQLPRQARRAAALGAVSKLGRNDYADREAPRIERSYTSSDIAAGPTDQVGHGVGVQ